MKGEERLGFRVLGLKAFSGFAAVRKEEVEEEGLGWRMGGRS